MSTEISHQEIRIQAVENIKQKATRQIERTEVDKFNKGD